MFSCIGNVFAVDSGLLMSDPPKPFLIKSNLVRGLAVKPLISLFLLLLVLVVANHAVCGVRSADAAETRGLTVVAKDSATGQSEEVNLYNKSYAVVIGIDTYKNLPPDRQLKYAVKDAKGVEDVLSKNFRFEKIIPLYNQEATKDRILEVLTEELPAQMGDKDSLFLFWAGHGDQEQGAQGKEIGYLIPYDGEVGKIRKNLTMTELRDTISTKLPAKHVFYVMDTCYGGLMASTRAIDKKSRRDLSYLKEITKENVRQVLTAGGKDEEVLDGGPKGHSVFTGRLIEALEAAGDFITANEIQVILKERVYFDSKGRGKTQTPAFSTISGNGDYVFIPSNDYKLAEQQAKIDRVNQENERIRQNTEKYKKQMADDEVIIAAALKAGDDSKRQTAELAFKRKQGLLKQEEAKQKENDEQLRRAEREAAELKQLDAERQRIREDARLQQAKLQEAESHRATELTLLDQKLLRDKGELERQSAELRLQGEAKRKKALEAASAALSIEAAVELIRKADEQIAAINSEFDADLARLKNGAVRRLVEKQARLKTGYDKRLLELKSLPTVSVTKAVIPPRDEFETRAEYQAREQKVDDDYRQRLAEARSVGGSAERAEKKLYDMGVEQAVSAHRTEAAAIDQRITAGRDEAIRPFRERITAVAAKEYPVSPQSLKLTVGGYDPENGKFPVSVTSTSSSVKLSVEGTLSLPRDKAKQFKRQYQDGLVRIEAYMKIGSSSPVRVAMLNDGVNSDADNYQMEYVGGEFTTVAERKRREVAAEVAAERDRLIYTDPQCGLMWAKNGNIAGKEMKWDDAMNWVKNLNYGGFSDWRLPTKDELASFSKRGGSRPSEWFNANGFNFVQADGYWSSTTYANKTGSAWIVSMSYGGIGYDYKTGNDYVWPVRGGQ